MRNFLMSKAGAGLAAVLLFAVAAPAQAATVGFVSTNGGGSGSPALTPGAVTGLTYTGTVTFGFDGIPVTQLAVSSDVPVGSETLYAGSTLTALSATLNFTASRVTSGSFLFEASNGSTLTGTFNPSGSTGLLIYNGNTGLDNYTVSGISTASSLSNGMFGSLNLGGFQAHLPLDGPYTNVVFAYNSGTNSASDAGINVAYTFAGSSSSPLPAGFGPSMLVLGGLAVITRLRRKKVVC